MNCSENPRHGNDAGLQHSDKATQKYGSVTPMISGCNSWPRATQTNLVCCIKVSPVFHQAFHNIMVTPSRRCQEWSLPFFVSNVHIATCFTECFGNRVVAMPSSTMQWGLFFLSTRKIKKKKSWTKYQEEQFPSLTQKDRKMTWKKKKVY